jgi:nucleoside-triphosphatase
MRSTHVLLLTGVPGTGKTTVLRRVTAALAAHRVAGFATEEMRKEGRRVGFRIVPLHGSGGVMAHVDFRSSRRVGRYGVDVGAIDAAAKTALALAPEIEVYLVDEIGKMECFSQRFVASMRALLDSEKPVVATIAQRGGGFIAEVKCRRDVEVWQVTVRNRDSLVDDVLGWLRL